MSKRELREFVQFVDAVVESGESETIEGVIQFSVFVHLSPLERIKLSLSMLLKAAIDAAKGGAK
jgi:hypothetical protein